jgi:hypothetical protein
MRRWIPITTAVLLGGLALTLGPEAAAGNLVELDEAEVFIEWNSTDDDYGIQFFWDGEPWRRMKVKNHKGRVALDVKARKNVKAQGLTEGFFESAEPGADELPLEEFLERFPEGDWEFKGRGIEGDKLFGEAEFTHVLPAPPTGLDPEEDDVVSHLGFTASFDPVTKDTEGNDIDIVFYELVVESEDDEPYLRVFSVILSPDVTSVEIPADFLEPDTEYKLEVIAQEESGNRTISETGLFTTDSAP